MKSPGKSPIPAISPISLDARNKAENINNKAPIPDIVEANERNLLDSKTLMPIVFETYIKIIGAAAKKIEQISKPPSVMIFTL